MDEFNIGDKVKNKRDGKYGLIVNIFESGSIAVLEKINPVVICTHDSFNTLEMVERHSVPMFDER